jgi:PIN domain nuclease of toxin-antitoxin system
MSVLLDTHVLLWFQSLDKRLSRQVRERIETADEVFCISHVTFWEIAIKNSIGKLTLDRDLTTTFRLIHEAGFLILPLREEHFLAASSLPLHHRDPFDRMLVAQAQHEGMHLITADPHFAAYEVPVIAP